ncbi:MAG: DNA-binding protein [Gammaproteobacteria bacterium]|nr:DNA-binding protein [Gammaproteobacteria bacterium]
MTTKRFIAGAVCPKCQLIDKIVVYGESGAEVCECVRCGHKQYQEVEAKPAVAKIGKREQVIKVIRPQKQKH